MLLTRAIYRICRHAHVDHTCPGHGMSNVVLSRNNPTELLQSQFDLLSVLQDGTEIYFNLQIVRSIGWLSFPKQMPI